MARAQAEWREFEQKVIPPGAGEIQRREMRNAFFAGFASAISVVAEIAVNQGTDEAVEALSQLHQELITWLNHITNGRPG